MTHIVGTTMYSDKLKPEDVKIGTEIVESRGGFGFRGYEFGKVVRETKTQWVTDLGSRYRKEDLRAIGTERYGRMTAKTAEHVERHNTYILERKIGNLIYDLSSIRNSVPEHLSTEELKDIIRDLERTKDRLTMKGE